MTGLSRLAAGPGTSPALSIVTLALSVGANLVVFTIVNAIWLRPSPIPDAERVVLVLRDTGSSATTDTGTFTQLLNQYVGRDVAFTSTAGQVATSGTNARFAPRISLAGTGHLETVAITSEYFGVLGLPIVGRDFTADDDRAGAEPVAIISNRLLRRAFGGSTDVLATVVDAHPMPLRIIGVAPGGFTGARLGEQADLWIPSGLIPRVARPGMAYAYPPFLVLARLRPGVTIPEATAALDQGVVSQSGGTTPARTAHVVMPIGEVYGSPDRRTVVVSELRVLTAASLTAGLVFLSGCATLLAVVLVSYERRRQELAIRLALGSSRVRLARLLSAELIGLLATGTIAALLTADLALRVLPALELSGAIELGRLDLSLDWRVVAVAVLGTGLALTLAGAPAILRSIRHGLVLDLVASSPRNTASSFRLRQTALVAHVAATVVVLVGAGLFVRTIASGFGDRSGFDVDRTLFVRADAQPALTGGPGQSEDAVLARHAADVVRLTRELEQVPGIAIVAVGDAPIGPDQTAQAIRPKTLESATEERQLPVRLPVVGPGYFQALNVPVLAGRALENGDVVRSAVLGPDRRAVITASLAETFWPGRSPIGERLWLSMGSTRAAHDIIGVVGDFVQGSLRTPSHHGLFIATDVEHQALTGLLQLTVRTSGDAFREVEAVRDAVLNVFPNAAGLDIATGREIVRRDLGEERAGAWFFSGFGVVALLLGLAGVFGLVAHLAESRRRELGIRLALGATPRALGRLLAGAGLWPVVVGTVAGFGVAALLVRVIRGLIHGVDALDPISYGMAGLLMLAGSAVAAATAAVRLRRISPAEALRAE